MRQCDNTSLEITKYSYFYWNSMIFIVRIWSAKGQLSKNTALAPPEGGGRQIQSLRAFRRAMLGNRSLTF